MHPVDQATGPNAESVEQAELLTMKILWVSDGAGSVVIPGSVSVKSFSAPT